jgi:transcriptional regulator CtsR
MLSTREKVEAYVKTRITESKDRVVEITCEDIVRDLSIAPSTCYLYLRVVCRDVGGRYERGKCIVIKP